MIDGGMLLHILIYLVVWGLVFYVCWWGLGKAGLPEPFNKIAVVVLVVLIVVVLLNLLFGFMGTPLFTMRR